MRMRLHFFIYTSIEEILHIDKIVVSLEMLNSLQSSLEVLSLIRNILQMTQMLYYTST